MELSLSRLVIYFLRLGAMGFGGPFALVASMKADLVDKLGWFTEQEYEEGFAFSQAAPGPIAPQLAMYLAYLRYGVRGSTLVVVAFIFAPLVLVLVLSHLYVQYGRMGWIQSVLFGITPAVVALITHAAWKLGRGMLKDLRGWIIAAASFALMTFWHVEISLIIIGAGLLGLLATLYRNPAQLAALVSPLLLFQAGVQTLDASQEPLFLKLALFFFKAGALTFGSGYVVVAFLQQGVVDNYHWLTLQQFFDGVAIGQVTPGPVVITAAFVGYLTEGLPGALISMSCVLLPIYLITIVASPFVRKLRANRFLQGFISSANAAALGTIASVAVTMATGTVTNWLSALVVVGALAALLAWNVPSILIILAAGAIGFVVQ